MNEEKRNIFLRRGDFTKELISLRRLVMAICIVQLIGGSLGILIKRFDSLFLNFWFGAAISTIFGYLLGLSLLKKTITVPWKTHRQMLLFLGLLSLTLFVAALLLPSLLERSLSVSR